MLYEKLYGSVRSPRKRGKIKRKDTAFVDNFFRLEWQLGNFIIFFSFSCDYSRRNWSERPMDEFS